MQARTSYGERAREGALRYSHMECVDYLDWAGNVCYHSRYRMLVYRLLVYRLLVYVLLVY